MALPAEFSVRQVFDMPASPAEVSLKRYAEQTGLDVLFATEVTAGATTRAVKGEFTRAEALNLMLADTGLVAACDETSGVITIKRSIPNPMTPNILKKFRHTLLGLVFSAMTGQQLAAAESPPTAKPSEQTSESKEEDIVKLNPFVVVHKQEAGYGYSESSGGTRTVQPVLNIPTSVALMNQQFLSDLNATSMAEVLDYGVSGVTNSTINSDDVNIRGFRSNQALRDGVMVINFKRNPMYDVAGIEVIKGPSGLVLGNTLFLGGVVNYVTKMGTENQMASVQTTVGTRDSNFRVSADSSGPIKRSDDYTALYRVTVGGEWGDPERPIDAIEETFVGASLTFKYFKDRLRLDVNYYNFVNNGYSYFSEFLDINRSVVNGPAYLNQYATATFGAARPDQVFFDQRQDYFNATLTGQLTENSNFRIYYVGHRVIDRRALLRAISVLSDNKTLTRQELMFNVDTNIDMIQAEYLYKTVRSAWRNDLQAGMDAYFETFWQRYALNLPPNLDSSNPDYTYTRPAFTGHTASNGRAEKRNGTYWAQENLTLFNNHLILIAGLRWVDSYVVNENPLTKVSTIADSPLVRTHRYGFVYKPTEQISLYYADAANVTAVGGTDGYGNAFKNQDGVLKESGLKVALKRGDLDFSGSIAYFDMANTNISITKTDPVLGLVLVQDPTGDTAKGWETDLRLRWKTSTGYADLIATYIDMTTFRVSTGRRALEAPDTAYSLFGKYGWESGPLAGFSFGGGLHDQSMKLTGTYTTDYPMTYTMMAKYDLNRHWSVQLNGENITDERYVVNVANAALVQASQGANYRLLVKYIW
jgi:iron complex outermembrane receptor protein